MKDRIRFFFNHLDQQLWFKPLLISLLSILAAFTARMADRLDVLQNVPSVTANSLETLLGIIAASMLGIAVFAVGAMLSAYASASSSATPRTFPLVIADDVSQNALSSFIGAFIFSIVSLIALMNGYYGRAGRLLLFLITAGVFGLVIFNFLRWLDSIARLGRLGNTIDKVEKVTFEALKRRAENPTLGGQKAEGPASDTPIYPDAVGYVQRIDMPRLQSVAEKHQLQLTLAVLPGSFVSPGQPLLTFHPEQQPPDSDQNINIRHIQEAFPIKQERNFTEDPRFGLVVLSEIASRALSPAVNDPGTAIDILNTLIRLFNRWESFPKEGHEVKYDRVSVPELSLQDMFDDAFNPIARDGAGTLEVALRLQQAFNILGTLGSEGIQQAARDHARLALRYAEKALKLPEEITVLKEKAHLIQDQ